MKSTLSTRETNRACSYEPTNPVSSGYLIQIYTDGHLAITSKTSWQGSRTGERWVTKPGFLDVFKVYGVIPKYFEKAQEGHLRNIIMDFEDDLYNGNGRTPEGFRKVNNGWIVK